MDNVTKVTSKSFLVGLRKNSVQQKLHKKSYNNDSDEGYFLEVDVQYHENLHNLPNFPFCLKEWKLKKLKKFEQTYMKYVIHISTLKQAINHGSYWGKYIE